MDKVMEWGMKLKKSKWKIIHLVGKGVLALVYVKVRRIEKRAEKVEYKPPADAMSDEEMLRHIYKKIALRGKEKK